MLGVPVLNGLLLFAVLQKRIQAEMMQLGLMLSGIGFAP